MAYNPTVWKNREVEKPRTFEVQDNPDGTITLIPSEGKVNEPGTPIMAVNMNKIEDELVRQDGVVTKHLDDNTMHTPYVVSTGTSSLYNVDLGPNVTQLVPGLSFSMKAHVTCILGPKVSVNGLPAVYMTKPSDSLILANELRKDVVITLVYNGTFFVVQGMLEGNHQKLAVTPWSGWVHDSTYNITVQKIGEKMVRVFGFIKKTSNSSPILCVIPEGYRPVETERVPFMFIAATAASNTFKTFNQSYLYRANGYIMFDSTELNSVKNDTYIYYDFSYSIV